MHGPAPARRSRRAARAARNALRHGLNVPVARDPLLVDQVDALARTIAGPNPNREISKLARRVAEAQIDLRRARDARARLLSSALRDTYYRSRADLRAELKLLRAALRSNRSIGFIEHSFRRRWRDRQRSLWKKPRNCAHSIDISVEPCPAANSQFSHWMRRANREMCIWAAFYLKDLLPIGPPARALIGRRRPGLAS
jgi:hypothetical protein